MLEQYLDSFAKKNVRSVLLLQYCEFTANDALLLLLVLVKRRSLRFSPYQSTFNWYIVGERWFDDESVVLRSENEYRVAIEDLLKGLHYYQTCVWTVYFAVIRR
jgi:hypothetical protein